MDDVQNVRDRPTEEVVLAGFLLRSAPDAVRLVTGQLCLDFAAEDVVGVDEQPLPDDVRASFAIPVQLRLRVGARLLNASPCDFYRQLLFKERKPFAITARAEQTALRGLAAVQRVGGRVQARDRAGMIALIASPRDLHARYVGQLLERMGHPSCFINTRRIRTWGVS